MKPVFLLSVVLALYPGAADAFRLEYRYDLSTPAGALRTNSVVLAFDQTTRELYVIGYGQVRIFNEAGMEVFSFGDDAELGAVYGAAALETGELIVLSYDRGRPSLRRTNFRGEPSGRVELRGVPGEWGDGFRPNRLAYAKGKLYLLDESAMRVVVAAQDGRVASAIDLAATIQQAEKRQELAIQGFGVDEDGNLLFTVAPLFKVYVLSPQGQLRSFGQSGSAPGRFNVIAGVGSDEAGRIYVVDSLKCAVMVFDREFAFLGEYGYRGRRPGELIFPTNLAVGGGKVYVSQNGLRGVSVYKIVPE